MPLEQGLSMGAWKGRTESCEITGSLFARKERIHGETSSKEGGGSEVGERSFSPFVNIHTASMNG